MTRDEVKERRGCKGDDVVTRLRRLLVGILILEGRRVTGEFRDDGRLVSFALEIRSKKREGESIE